MLRKYALTVVFLFVVCGAAAQLPDDEYYPYGTGYEQRTPIVLTDSSLFYRAIQTMPDLYGSISAFNLPYIALGRRGQHYSSEAASFSGLGISSRYFGSLRLLGAREERRAGIAALPEAIGGAGGVRTFRFPGALAEPSCHASVSFTDRNYLAGAKLAYARPAGRGWDVAAAVEARTGRDMHVEGVFTNALTAGFRASRHLGEGHTLGFLLIVPPSVRGTRLSSVEEAFRLTGDNLYNPAWGFQDGKVRNSRVRREFVPLAAATYCVRLSPATWLDMAAGAEYGVRKYSALGWYDARTPMPDNYRYLPGYTGDRETELAWRSNDARYTQVCWDELIARNRMAGGHAVYTLEDRAERIRNLGFDALFTTAPDERLTLRYGFSYRHARTRSYKQMRDLLGADHITDIDQYLVDDDTYGNLLQNDLRHPGRTVREGDRFGYDYALSTREATVRLSAEYRSDRLRADVALALGDAVVLRRGYYEKELFPGTQSLGRSRRMGFTPYTVKALVGHYSLRRRHARRHPVPPLLRRHGGCLQRHGRYGHRTHGLRRGGRCRPPPGIPLEPFARRFGRAVQIYPQPARHGHLRRRQFGRRHPCRKPHGRMYARCRTPAYGLRRTLIFRPPGMGFPRLGGICGAALRRACAPAPYGTHRAAGRHHAGDVRCLHAPGAPRRRLHVRRLAFQILLFRPFAADRFAHAAQPAGRCRYGLQRLRVAARPAYPFGRRPLFRTPRHALYLCLSAFVLSYDLL